MEHDEIGHRAGPRVQRAGAAEGEKGICCAGPSLCACGCQWRQRSALQKTNVARLAEVCCSAAVPSANDVAQSAARAAPCWSAGRAASLAADPKHGSHGITHTAASQYRTATMIGGVADAPSITAFITALVDPCVDEGVGADGDGARGSQ